MRRIGEIDGINDRPAGDHVCWGYTSDAAYRSTMLRFFSGELRRGTDRLVYYGPPPHQLRLVADLGTAGHDVARLIDTGALVIGSGEECYLRDERFDADKAIRSWRDMVESALADGFTGLRAIGDVTQLVARPEYRGLLPGYELRADLLAATMPFTAVCAYDVRGRRASTMRAIRAVHPLGFSLDDRVKVDAFQIHGTQRGGIAVRGEIDLLHAADVRDILVAGAQEALPELDVSALRFADVQAVRAIGAGAGALRQRYGNVRIRGARPAFARIWSLLGYETFSSVEVVA